MKAGYFITSPGKIKVVSLSFLVVVLMWGITILPSSFRPYWCYLDDPSTLLMGKSLASNFHIPKPDGETGRYVPFSNIYYGLLFKLFEYKLQGYYIVQCLMFLFATLMIYSIILSYTGRMSSGILGAFLFLTASPVAENAYTLGKAEPKILFYLLCSIYIFRPLISHDCNRRKLSKLISWAAITILIFVAILTKETAGVIIVFAVAGGAVAFLFHKKSMLHKYDVKPYLLLLITSAFSAVMARALFYSLRPSDASSVYTTYTVNSTLVLNNLKFYAAQQPDVLLLGLITALFLAVLYKRNELNTKFFVFGSAIFFTGLAYILGQLIWRWPLGYYLLVPASLFSIAIVTTLYSPGLCSGSKRIIYVSIVLILLTRVYSLPYFWYIANSQKAQDRIYTEAIGYYLQWAKPGERLLVEQWPFFVEPVFQSNILVKMIHGKEQLQIEGIQDIVSNIFISPDTLKLYGLTKIPDKSTRMPRKNDYILNFTGDRQSPWILRGSSPFLNEKESTCIAQGMQLEKIIEKEVSWKGLQLWYSSVLPKFKQYSAGYKLYKVKDPATVILWEGKWSDNWISNIAKCSFWVQKEKEKFFFTGVVTEHTIPSSLYLVQDNNNIIKRIILDKSGPFSFILEFSSAKKGEHVVLDLVTGKTFNPKTLGINNDERNLSIQIAIQRISDTD